jgi:hypothetical protein
MFRPNPSINLKAHFELEPGLRLARTPKIWSNKIVWFDQIRPKGCILGLGTNISVLGGKILGSNLPAALKSWDEVFLDPNSQCGPNWAHMLDNEPLGAEGPPLVGEEVRKKEVGKVGS